MAGKNRQVLVILYSLILVCCDSGAKHSASSRVGSGDTLGQVTAINGQDETNVTPSSEDQPIAEQASVLATPTTGVNLLFCEIQNPTESVKKQISCRSLDRDIVDFAPDDISVSVQCDEETVENFLVAEADSPWDFSISIEDSIPCSTIRINVQFSTDRGDVSDHRYVLSTAIARTIVRLDFRIPTDRNNLDPLSIVPDTTGSENRGIAVGFPDFTPPEDNFREREGSNTSLIFQDNGSFVTIPHSKDFELDHGSVTLRLVIDSIGSDRDMGIFSKDSINNGAGHMRLMIVNSEAEAFPGHLRLRLQTIEDEVVLYSHTPLKIDTDYKIEIRFDSKSVSLALNEVEQAQVPFESNAWQTNAEAIVIGADGAGSIAGAGTFDLNTRMFFKGAIDFFEVQEYMIR